jgi:hypothetical protein
MSKTADAALRILMEADFRALRRHWADLFPHAAEHGPKSDKDAEFSLHYARTITKNVPLGMRQYSHRFLEERGLPSGLPDELKPTAERIEPRVVAAVGITVGTKPYSPLIRRSMENAVLEAEADGRLEDDEFVRGRIQEARSKTIKELFGSVAIPKLEGMKK